MSRNHMIITGTGRCGTSFLVELLTRLGLATGFTEESLAQATDSVARAGLEHDMRDENCPFIVKDPWFCDYVDEILSREDIVIDHVFIPMRDLFSAAESRRFVTRSRASKLPLSDKLKIALRLQKVPSVPGGLWYTKSTHQGDQEKILIEQLYNLLLAMSKTSWPVTFMHYPRIVEDSYYLYEKLYPALSDIAYAQFLEVFQRTVKPRLVHNFS